MNTLNRRALCLGALAVAGCSRTSRSPQVSLPKATRSAAPLPASALATALTGIEQATGSDGISASVLRPGGETWTSQTGRGAEVWGSVTKVPVAATVVALAEDGVWSLDDPVGRYVALSWGDRVSLSDLLGHTSGLPREIDMPEVAIQTTEAERTALNALEPARPGVFSYSNAGYRALGLAIETVGDRPWQEIVRDRALRQTGAQDLSFPPRNASPERAAPGAAGSLRGPASEVAPFLNTLLSGDLLSPAGLDAMLSPVAIGPEPALNYTRGFMLYNLPDGTMWLGHSGGTRGGRAIAVWIPDKNAVIALAMRGTGSAEAGANMIASAL